MSEEKTESVIVKLGTFSISAKSGGCPDLSCDRISIAGDGAVMLLSVVAPTQEIKALRALMSGSSGRVSISAGGVRVTRVSNQRYDNDKSTSNLRLTVDADGYACYLHRIGYGEAHAIFISRRSGFLPVTSDLAMWNELKDPRYTTPILREWMPHIKEKLEEQDLLRWCWGYRAKCALMHATTEDLDKIVEEGIQGGTLLIPEEEATTTS